MLLLSTLSPHQSEFDYPICSILHWLPFLGNNTSWSNFSFKYLRIPLAATIRQCFGSSINMLIRPKPNDMSGILLDTYRRKPTNYLNRVLSTEFSATSFINLMLASTGVDAGLQFSILNLLRTSCAHFYWGSIIFFSVFTNSNPRKYAYSPRLVISNSDCICFLKLSISLWLLLVISRSSTHRHTNINSPPILIFIESMFHRTFHKSQL